MTMIGESYYTYCPKCGNRMFGPRYDNLRDALRYRCGCGYETQRAPLDQRRRNGLRDTTEQLRELVKQMQAGEEG